MSPTERLTANSTVITLLRKGFDEGEVNGDDDPKTIWSSRRVFSEHKLDNFRTRFNKLKNEFFDEYSKSPYFSNFYFFN